MPFFSKAELNTPTMDASQRHVVRHAFEPIQLVPLC
jgi:hypothetical protein